MTIEYNEKNVHVRQVLTGLLGSGITIFEHNEERINLSKKLGKTCEAVRAGKKQKKK